MTNEDGTVVATYNGELYNYKELRRSLVKMGHLFRTRGDTEVLVHLYEEVGLKIVDYLDGMFAFGLYDKRRHSLLLARDRIGIKPLYYWHRPPTGEVLFASDLGAMLSNPLVPRQLNPQALAQYLHFGYVIHPESWVREVRQLEPGQLLEWRNGKINLKRYCQWHYQPCSNLENPKNATRVLHEVLSDSVSKHLVADVSLGGFLSGGLDSTAINGFAQQACLRANGKINSFTVRFDEADFDESLRARAIARDLGTHHSEIDAKGLPFDRSFINRLVDDLGEPFGDTSALAVYALCQQARTRVKVALSGDGGDELFLGYKGLRKQRAARHLRAAPSPVRQLLASLTTHRNDDHVRKLNKALRLSLLDDQGLIIDWARRWEWSDLSVVLGGDLFANLFPRGTGMFPEIRELIGKGDGGGFLEQQIRFHLLVDLPCDCLFKVDRMSMAHGLEVRVPMLSNDMLAFGERLPLGMRTQSGRTKEPLRTLAEGLAPTITRPAPKHGFGFPLDSWLRGGLPQLWREGKLSATLSKLGFRSQALDSLVSGYARFNGSDKGYRTNDLARRLFDLLLLAVWSDNYGIYT
jgi:asparagine synthase (glutamine-hydrolysing)